MSVELDKEYRPAEVEDRWVRAWEEAGLFVGNPESGKQPFCMVIPPPNITGNLHIGHVLVYTLHDIVARWRRMEGRDVLWLPGTDHAGIATQMVVERELAKEGVSRHDLGREGFEKRVWEWKETYGNRITTALRLLGSSCDWTRERFTFDEGLSRAVRTVFVRLYDEGLIYRDRYIVNWCVRCHTAISDLETVHEPVQGKLYTIRYPAAGGEGEPIVVATTRPETLLGDTGVAVHPDDERFAGRVGGKVQIPLTGREVEILADDFVDPEFGTGAVKITPGHDPTDFAAGQRHGLPQLIVIDNDGRMTAEAGEAYAGLDRFEARAKVVADLEAKGLLVDVRDHEHAVGHCQRCGTMIEQLVSTQWFVRVEALAREAIEAVEQGTTRFVPDSWSKTYFEWMRNIHDWCISRQLWWGHRIPAWYCDACDKTFVSEDDLGDCAACGGALRRDEDVLDTWFSSALWPFSTLGWPEKTRDLEHYYPTTLLITGHDIIFFWVARMMMMGLKFMGDVPFGHVYIHGLVRDAKGQKMSKSKGNTIDPEELQERYGTDAVRLTMAMLAAPGNDIPLAPQRMEGYRAFVNKLWNATRFVLMRVGDAPPEAYEREQLTTADRWILSRAQATSAAVQEAFEAYRFDHAADALYHFVWHQFCDWYIEAVKPDFSGDDADRVRVARSVLLEVLGTLLRLLHPVTPFITEELWRKLPGTEGTIALADWPVADPAKIDVAAEAEMERVQAIVVQVRNLRAETGIDAAKRIVVQLHAEPGDAAALGAQSGLIAVLTRASEACVVEAIDPDLLAARGVAGGVQIAIPLEGTIDLEAERARVRKQLDKIVKQIEGQAHKLGNESFLQRAPAEVIEKQRRQHGEATEMRDKLERLLTRLGAGSS